MTCGIYKITNNINGKVYIGQSIRIEERWADHLTANDDWQIHQAIKKYGANNFTFEVIEECPQEDLDDREMYWISYYNSFKKGYNMTLGGEGGFHYSYDEIRKLWSEGYGTLKIKEMTGASLNTICRALQGEPLFNNGESQSRNKGQLFSQYSPEGKWIATYSSYNELLRVMDINIEMVKRCLYDSLKPEEEKRNRSAEGYQWRYGDNKEDIPPIKITHSGHKKPVIQYDKNNNLIKVYSSVAEAHKETGINHISGCCLGKIKTARGYKWKYKED